MIEHDTYRYPPELFSLLVDTIPLLCRSKRDLLLFFRGAGMSPSAMFEVEEVGLDSAQQPPKSRLVLYRRRI
jgi:hypothetical protein